MKSTGPIPIVVFAQVPPPEHGQSRMVQVALETLLSDNDGFEVYHVNARFSESLDDIGESSLRKAFPIAHYIIQAAKIRFGLTKPLLYYVPGPAKWSAVVRDWVLLIPLRILYPKVLFHWHAIGHGEWAHGSDRIVLEGPSWLERLARKISALVLERPYASFSVSDTSRKDALAVASLHDLVLYNGIVDPIPSYLTDIEPQRISTRHDMVKSTDPHFRILFLSHGTEEKGLLDAVASLRILLENTEPGWSYTTTFAGGVSEQIRERFDREMTELRAAARNRLNINLLGYVSGVEKSACYQKHDIFLAPSRWESFGLTVVEAMAYGMEIVAAASDGVTGLLPDGYPYLVPVGDHKAMAKALNDCCQSLRNDSPRHGPHFRKRFIAQYEIGKFSRDLLRLVAELENESSIRANASETSKHGVYSAKFPFKNTSLYGHEILQLGGNYHFANIPISIYLADQNPGHDRSYGISRMSQVVFDALERSGRVELETVVSRTSQKPPDVPCRIHILPWGTRKKSVRLLTDHLHPLFVKTRNERAIHYFPKGYLPIFDNCCKPSVVTIHDTIIQYDEDHYPEWRKPWEYSYWSLMLKHTLRNSDRIMTVSESSKRQILSFMERHRINLKDIAVTYEPCLYEGFPQPLNQSKADYVIHLASCEPHKRTTHLIRWWRAAEASGLHLPVLHLIGNVPQEVLPIVEKSKGIVKRPFLSDDDLKTAYQCARSLILPSEIEGFGLPALEAYYLGTPVCYVRGTSVEEVLAVATNKGGFDLDDPASLFEALDEVLAMSPSEIGSCGRKLRETYAAEKVVGRMLEVFEEVCQRHGT